MNFLHRLTLSHSARIYLLKNKPSHLTVGIRVEIPSRKEVRMKNFKLFFNIILLSTIVAGSALVKSNKQLSSHQKRLFKEHKYNRCFYYEPVRKSDKYGWLNNQEAQKIANLKQKPVFAQNSPSDMRRVFVPKTWCQGS